MHFKYKQYHYGKKSSNGPHQVMVPIVPSNGPHKNLNCENFLTQLIVDKTAGKQEEDQQNLVFSVYM